jgi:hypothetical protein
VSSPPGTLIPESDATDEGVLPDLTSVNEPACYDPPGGGLIHSFLELDGVEIANAARTVAYIKLGLAGGAWEVTGDGCVCDVLQREAAGAHYRGAFDSVTTYAAGDVVIHDAAWWVALVIPGVGVAPPAYPWVSLFRSPVLDPAPWYDQSRPESGEFLGLLIDEQRPWTDDAVSRSVVERGGSMGGANIGPIHRSSIQLAVAGTLAASTFRGIEYGRRWLAAQLAGCDPCGGTDARIRTWCPPCDGSADDEGEYLLYDVALTAGVRDVIALAEAPNIQDITFELTAGNGWFYKRPSTDTTTRTLLDKDPCAASDFCTWLTGTPVAVCHHIAPPGGPVGIVGAQVEVQAGSLGITDLYITVAVNATGQNLGTVHLPYLPPWSTFWMDSAKHQLTFMDSAGVMSDGAPYIDLPSGESVPWLEMSSCNPGTDICAGVNHYCAQTMESIITITTQERDA